MKDRINWVKLKQTCIKPTLPGLLVNQTRLVCEVGISNQTRVARASGITLSLYAMLIYNEWHPRRNKPRMGMVGKNPQKWKCDVTRSTHNTAAWTQARLVVDAVESQAAGTVVLQSSDSQLKQQSYPLN